MPPSIHSTISANFPKGNEKQLSCKNQHPHSKLDVGVAVSKCVTPWKLSSNQYLLHCASGSGESVGDLSEQCDLSVCIHLLLHDAGLRVHAECISCSSVHCT